MKRQKYNLGQVFVGFVFAFLGLLLLAIGLVRIWAWFGGNVANRSYNYQKTRVASASGRDVPLNVTAKPLTLTKDWVFNAKTAGGENFDKIEVSDYKDAEMEDARKCCRGCCSGDEEDGPLSSEGDDGSGCSCALISEGNGVLPPDLDTNNNKYDNNEEIDACFQTVNVTAVDESKDDGSTVTTTEKQYMYDCPCQLRCECRAGVQQKVDMLRLEAKTYVGEDLSRDTFGGSDSDTTVGDFGHFKDKAIGAEEGIYGQAGNLVHEAEALRVKANDCDDPWEICWWGGFGRTATELRAAASDLDSMAKEMFERAIRLVGNDGTHGFVDDYYHCCDKDTELQQDVCLVDLQLYKIYPCGSLLSNYKKEWMILATGTSEDKYSGYWGKAEALDHRLSETYGTATSCMQAAEAYCRIKITTKIDGADNDGDDYKTATFRDAFELDEDTADSYWKKRLYVQMNFTGGHYQNDGTGTFYWTDPSWTLKAVKYKNTNTYRTVTVLDAEELASLLNILKTNFNIYALNDGATGACAAPYAVQTNNEDGNFNLCSHSGVSSPCCCEWAGPSLNMDTGTVTYPVCVEKGGGYKFPELIKKYERCLEEAARPCCKTYGAHDADDDDAGDTTSYQYHVMLKYQIDTSDYGNAVDVVDWSYMQSFLNSDNAWKRDCVLPYKGTVDGKNDWIGSLIGIKQSDGEYSQKYYITATRRGEDAENRNHFLTKTNTSGLADTSWCEPTFTVPADPAAIGSYTYENVFNRESLYERYYRELLRNEKLYEVFDNHYNLNDNCKDIFKSLGSTLQNKDWHNDEYSGKCCTCSEYSSGSSWNTACSSMQLDRNLRCGNNDTYPNLAGDCAENGDNVDRNPDNCGCNTSSELCLADELACKRKQMDQRQRCFLYHDKTIRNGNTGTTFYSSSYDE